MFLLYCSQGPEGVSRVCAGPLRMLVSAVAVLSVLPRSVLVYTRCSQELLVLTECSQGLWWGLCNALRDHGSAHRVLPQGL